ncbi:Uncharacterised protein [Collinsella intestinalis]|nr:Uncharacterised protein [Collinsella intestinalis]
MLQLEHVAVLAGGDDATVEALTAIAVVLVQRVARCVRQGDPERELLLLVNLGALVLGELDGLADLQGAGLGEVLRGRVGIDHGSMVAKLDVGGVRDAVGERGLVHPGLKGHGAGGVGLNVVDLPRQLVLVLVEGAAIARGAVDVGEALGQLVSDGHRRGILARVRIAHGVSEDVTDLDIALVGILDFLPGNEDLGLGGGLSVVIADLDVGLVLDLVVERGLGHLDREAHGTGGVCLLLAEIPRQGVGVVDAAVSRGILDVGRAGRNLIGDGHVGGDSLTSLVDRVVHPADGVDELATDLDELAVDRRAGLALGGDVLALRGLLIRVGEGHDLARDLQNPVRRLAGVVLDLVQDGGRRERSAVRLDGDDKLVLGLGEGQVGVSGRAGLDDSVLVRAGLGEADAAEAHGLVIGGRRGSVAGALGHGCVLGHSLELEGVGLVREPITSLEDLLDLQRAVHAARDHDGSGPIGVGEGGLGSLILGDCAVHRVGNRGEAVNLMLRDLVLSALGQALDGDGLTIRQLDLARALLDLALLGAFIAIGASKLVVLGIRQGDVEGELGGRRGHAGDSGLHLLGDGQITRAQLGRFGIGADHGAVVTQLDVGIVVDALLDGVLVDHAGKGDGAGLAGRDVSERPSERAIRLVIACGRRGGIGLIGDALGQLVGDGHRSRVVLGVLVGDGVDDLVTDLDGTGLTLWLSDGLGRDVDGDALAGVVVHLGDVGDLAALGGLDDRVGHLGLELDDALLPPCVIEGPGDGPRLGVVRAAGLDGAIDGLHARGQLVDDGHLLVFAIERLVMRPLNLER